LGVLALLGGCAGLADPFQREGTWSTSRINDDNLRAMIVNPVDLQQGAGPPDTLGAEAAAAVTRLRADNVKTLPDSTLSSVGSSAGSGGQQSTGAGLTGGAQ